jgi:putative ABC transport system permease protein
MDDAIYIPVLRGLEMFNRDGLFEVDVLYDKTVPSAEIEAGIKRVLMARHGAEDFTLTAQEEMLDVLGAVLDVVTFAIAGLGAISLLVGGVGIFTIMTIAVRERTAEIGLLRALGAARKNIRTLFLVESILLAALGGLGGLLLGMGIVEGTKLFVPALPLSYSIPYAVLAEVMAVFIGAVAGVLPARQAAGMDPIEALRAE